MVDAWFMSGLSNADKPGSITGVMGNEMALKNFTYTPGSGFSFSLFYCTLKNNSIFRVRVNCLIITYHFLLFLKNIMSLKERLC